MHSKSRLVVVFYSALVAVLTASLLSSCSPQFHKADADEEVYQIIDSKWQDDFGQKANYIVSDSNISSPNDIRIDNSFSEPKTLSLAEAVAIATANSRGYLREKESLYLTALSLTGIRHNYERKWFATVDGVYEDDSVTEPEASLSSEAGASQDFLVGDGIQISTSLAIDWLRFITGDPRTSLGSVLSASITAPIIGNGAGRQNRENLIQSERQVLYAIRSFNRYRQNFVVDTINAYYGVLQGRDGVTNAENNYQRRLESQERLVMEAEAGRQTKMDVDDAQQNVLKAMDSLVRTKRSYEQNLDNFKLRLAIPTDARIELDQGELAALENLGLTEPNFPVEDAIETAFVRRLDLANSQDAIDDAIRKVSLAADGLGLQLNVTADAGYESKGQTDFDRIRFHEGDYGLGFDADIPLDRKDQRNDYRRALIELERDKRQYEANIDNVKLEVREAYRLLQETAERYRIQKNSLELAKQRVESNKLLLDAGRVAVRIVLESQDALLNAQNDVTAAFVSHLDAKLSFYRDVGVLEVRPDGMWGQGQVTSIDKEAEDKDNNKGRYNGKDS